MSIETPHIDDQKIGPGHDPIEIVTDQDSQKWKDSAQLEFEEFRRAEYVDSIDELEEEYAPYRGHSKFISVSRQGEVVGSTRLILPGEAGFKTINDAHAGKLTITEAGWDILGGYDIANDGFEVGTLAVKDGYRTGPFHELSVSASLYAGITAYTGILAQEQGREGHGFVLASFDEEYLSKFADAFGPSVKELGPSQEYMGSKTTPVLIDVDQLLEDDHTGLTPLLLGLAESVKNNE